MVKDSNFSHKYVMKGLFASMAAWSLLKSDKGGKMKAEQANRPTGQQANRQKKSKRRLEADLAESDAGQGRSQLLRTDICTDPAQHLTMFSETV